MPFENKVSAQPAATSWPGVAPVKSKAVNKLGTVETAPPSLPRRVLQAIQHQVNKLRGSSKAQVGLPHLPRQANVGVQVLKAVASQLHRFDQGIHDGNVGQEAEARFAAQRMTVAFLAQVKSGAAQLTPAMQRALDGGDVKGFVAALRTEVLAQSPASAQPGVAQRFDDMLGPLLEKKLQRDGLPRVEPEPGPVLQPKTQLAAQLLPTAHLQDLSMSPKSQQLALDTMKQVAAAMETGDTDAVETALAELARQFKQSLASVGTPETLKLAFALSDGQAFVDELGQAILAQANPDQRPFVKLELEQFARPYLQSMFDQMVSGVLDQVLTEDAHGPLQIEVQGRPYVRVGDQPLAHGKFGGLWEYVNPDNPQDRVVLKRPRDPDGKGYAATVTAPLREGQASVQAQGSGGTPGMSTLLGVLRSDDEVDLVYRYEPGGSMFDALAALNEQPSPQLSLGKLGLMADVVASVRHLVEDKGVAHFDLAMRNLILDALGRAKLIDFGLARLMPEGADSAQASVSLPADATVSIFSTAPEVLKGQPATAKSDVFGLGVILIEMLKGKTVDNGPWGLSPKRYTEQVKDGSFDPARQLKDLASDHARQWPGVDLGPLVALVTRMVDVDPARRPTLAEVAASGVFDLVKDVDREATTAYLSAHKLALPSPGMGGYDKSPVTPPGGAVPIKA